MKDWAIIIIVGALYLATVTALVRPKSRGPELINNIFNAFSDLVRGSLGESYDSKNKKWVPASK